MVVRQHRQCPMRPGGSPDHRADTKRLRAARWAIRRLRAGPDILLDGMGDNAELSREFLAALANLRNPALTPVLPDLEKEFGEHAERVKRAMND